MTIMKVNIDMIWTNYKLKPVPKGLAFYAIKCHLSNKSKKELTASTMPFSSFISVISGYPGRMGLSSRDDKSFDDDDDAAAFILSSSR